MVADAIETVTGAAESVPFEDASLADAVRTILPLMSGTLTRVKC